MFYPGCGTACPPGACGVSLSGAPTPLPNGAGAASVYPPPSWSSGHIQAIVPSGTLLQGRYRIERVVGQGAFGRIYRATDAQDPTAPPLAIKELLDQQFASPTDKREAIAWFKREVSTLLTLEHPGIPAIYGYWVA